MLFLWISGGILAFLLVLLLIPVIVCFDFEGGAPKLVIRYAFYWKKVLPVVDKEKERAKKKTRRGKKKKEKEADEANARLSDSLKTGLSLFHASKKSLRILRRGIVISHLKLLLSVGGEDAHDTAERYGKYAAALFPALDIVSALFTVREPSVYISPNFLSSETVLEASVRVRLLPMTILAAGLHVAGKFINILSTQKQHNQDSKGGIQYERKASRK